MIPYFTGTGNCLYAAHFHNEHVTLAELQEANSGR